MVDHSARVIAYYNGENGSTKFMILYVMEKGIHTDVKAQEAWEGNDEL